MIKRVLILAILLSYQLCLAQEVPGQSLVKLVQVHADTLFNSRQSISLLYVYQSHIDNPGFEFNHSGLKFKKTSVFAEERAALAAINGGFFNMDDGGSATYFEIDDSVISRTRAAELKWGISDSIINGAIIINQDLSLSIEKARPEENYIESGLEQGALVTGPLLLLEKGKLPLPDRRFIKDRHPRTCVCTTETATILIAIDGRKAEAAGMNLYEVQDYLATIGCIDAINLDGGGSSTMWLKGEGVVNNPSDKSGERRVSNVLLVVEN